MKFFVLRNPRGTESSCITDFYIEDPFIQGDAPRCDLCKRYIGGTPWLPPHSAELELWGKVFGDVALGSGNDLLISERMKTLVQTDDITGLEGFEPVKIVRVKRRRGRVNQAMPQYYHVSVVRGRAVVDQIKSRLEREPRDVCPECRTGGELKRMERLVIEPGTWSGEDIFIARGLPGTFVVTERFEKLCREHQVLNAFLVAAENFLFDDYPWEKRELG